MQGSPLQGSPTRRGKHSPGSLRRSPMQHSPMHGMAQALPKIHEVPQVQPTAPFAGGPPPMQLMAESPRRRPMNASPNRKTYSYPRSKIRVLLMENISQAAIDFFRSKGFRVDTHYTYTDEEMIERIGDYHMIGVRSKTKLRAHILKHAKKLVAIGHFCIGTDQTDLDVAAVQGVPVFNSPFANTRSVAELCIAQMVMLARGAGDRNKEMHKGVWNKTSKGCYELRGKTLGIIGYGHVGSQLGVLAEAFGMKVIFYDILPKMAIGNAQGMPSLHDVLGLSDFVSLHVPYTPHTDNMINHGSLGLMKKGSFLLNAARGKCVDIEAVADALKNGHLAGAFFDVYPKEPTNAEMVLCNIPNVTLTPHIGGATEEAQRNIGIDVASKLCRYMNEGATIGAVNFPNVDMPTSIEERHRIIHIHKNVPGVLKGINNVLSDYNVRAQILSTTDDIGVLLVELDADRQISQDVKEKLTKLPSSIQSRIIWSAGA